MADQPLNSNIQIYRRVRTQRELFRGDSVKNITGHLRRLVVVNPGAEVRSAYGARTTSVTDFSPFMGAAAGAATRGLPVTVGPKAYSDIKVIKHLTTAIDFPVEIGQDKFIQDTAAAVGTSDLFAKVNSTIADHTGAVTITGTGADTVSGSTAANM